MKATIAKWTNHYFRLFIQPPIAYAPWRNIHGGSLVFTLPLPDYRSRSQR